MIENSKQIVYQNTALYHYIQRNKSILGNITPKRINDQEKAFFERNKYLEKKYPEYLTEIRIDNIKNVKTIYYLAIMCGEKSLYNSKKYKDYYVDARNVYKIVKENIVEEDKKSIDLFFRSRILYKLYVKLKKVVRGRND